MSNDTCPHCNDPVQDGNWHRDCFLAVLGAILYHRFSRPHEPVGRRETP